MNRDLLALPQWAIVVVRCLRAASDTGLDEGTRRAWRRLAAARALYVVGDVLWAYDGWAGNGHPVAALASLCYLTSNPLVLWGLLSFPRMARTRRERAQLPWPCCSSTSTTSRTPTTASATRPEIGLGNSSRTSPLLRGIVDLGRAMQLQTTAEGVETEIQAAALREFGCEDAQGFLFARPLDPDVFLALLEKGSRLPAAVSA